MFIKINVNRNCFFIKLLCPKEILIEVGGVDFLQHRVLTHIRVAVFKAETKLKGNTKGLPDWPSFTYKD